MAYAETIYTPETLPKSEIVLPVPDKQSILANACDYDEKCFCINNAIFKHDSSWATAGIGKKTLNPCNMRPPKTWEPSAPFTVYHAKGNGKFARFETLADGINACVELYDRFYDELSANKLVSRWTDGGGNKAYHSAVSNCF